MTKLRRIISQNGVLYAVDEPSTPGVGLGIAEWDSSVEYGENDIVVDREGTWKATGSNTNSRPIAGNADWTLVGGTPYVDVDLVGAEAINAQDLHEVIPAFNGGAAYPLRWSILYIPGTHPYESFTLSATTSVASFTVEMWNGDDQLNLGLNATSKKWISTQYETESFPELTTVLASAPKASDSTAFPMLTPSGFNHAQIMLPLTIAPLKMRLTRDGDPLSLTDGAPTSISLEGQSLQPGYMLGQRIAILDSTGLTPGAYTEASAPILITVTEVSSAGEILDFTVDSLGAAVVGPAGTAVPDSFDSFVGTYGPLLTVLSYDRVSATIKIEGNHAAAFAAPVTFEFNGVSLYVQESDVLTVDGDGNTVIEFHDPSNFPLPHAVAPIVIGAISDLNDFTLRSYLFRYDITAIDVILKKITVSGDHTAAPIAGVGFAFAVNGSSGNDNIVFTTVSAVLSSGNTVITVNEVIPSPTANGAVVFVGFANAVQTFTVDEVALGDGILRTRVWYAIADLIDT